MLEKIGLPAKPSLRGNNWAVDASHCQGCSSQFTFINRKHHCRRCGGLFCGSCTQQRMVLRGQGDSPVRICEPCKKLEEAARFELRYGHKTRAAKGGSKHALKKDNEILRQILGNEDNVLTTQKSSSSSSSIRELAISDQPADMLTEAGSASPDDLRQQAAIEKQKYRTLKAEGKSEEALKAFKRGKELERQAGALEISLRKNRKRALSSRSISDTQQIEDETKASSQKSKDPSKKGKGTDDLFAELKELGWSDLDADKKPATLSLEGELSSLLREVSQKPNKEKHTVSTNISQVIAHKKKALELKRAGNLVGAKEELKKAKTLERKIEEEEFLGRSDESDDELASLIRSMDSYEHDDLSERHKANLDVDFNRLICMPDDIVVDGNFEVTDGDMDDPEISSALKSLGWEEDEDIAESEGFDDKTASSKKESYLTEIQSLKREALNQKRAGNTAEALALLKNAKLLEAELENSDTGESAITEKGTVDILISTRASANYADHKAAPKSKLTIQKELIALKKKALSLRREGRRDESDEELRKAKALEEQLEDMNKAPAVLQPSITNKQSYSTRATMDDGDEEEVTDRDMDDPSYLSVLKNLGWEDDNNAEVPAMSKENNASQKHIRDPSITKYAVKNETGAPRKGKSEIQRELLALKRKALTLRRQGEAEAAEEVLNMARSLEVQLQELEEPSQGKDSPENNKGNASSLQVGPHEPGDSESRSKDEIRFEKQEEIAHENEKPHEFQTSQATVPLQQEILAHKRKALALKRDGKLAEAREELRQAKQLEKHLEETPQKTANSSDSSASEVSSIDKEASPSSVSKPLSSRERFKLQQESLGHKRQALKLRREGRTAEADAEFELAKAIESRLEELNPHAIGSSEPVDDVGVEDFLDPELFAALQSIGMDDGRTKSQGVERPEPTRVDADVSTQREQLMEQIKAEKVKAVNLKRTGKQAEALDALRRAKLYEKKLQCLS